MVTNKLGDSENKLLSVKLIWWQNEILRQGLMNMKRYVWEDFSYHLAQFLQFLQSVWPREVEKQIQSHKLVTGRAGSRAVSYFTKSHFLLNFTLVIPVTRMVGNLTHYIIQQTHAAAKSLQSCPSLCDLTDGSPPGSTIPGILQARTLEWVAISFTNAWKWKVKVKPLSRVRLLATPRTAAYQAPLSMGFSRQEYWSGVPL